VKPDGPQQTADSLNTAPYVRGRTFSLLALWNGGGGGNQANLSSFLRLSTDSTEIRRPSLYNL
jgi:hypothetical protein